MLFYHVGDTIMSYHMLRIVFTWRHHFLKSKIKKAAKVSVLIRRKRGYIISLGNQRTLNFGHGGSWHVTATIAFIGKYMLISWLCFVLSFSFSLTHRSRKTLYAIAGMHRDNSFGPGWFRLQDAAGAKMPTSYVSLQRCRIHAPGKLNGAHPKVTDGKVTRKVWKLKPNYCIWSVSI